MAHQVINAAAPMEAPWAQVFIRSRLFQVRTPRLRHRAMQCHPHSICRRMTNCSQRTGECLGEQEIKLFILRKTFFWEIIFTHDLYMYINLQYCLYILNSFNSSTTRERIYLSLCKIIEFYFILLVLPFEHVKSVLIIWHLNNLGEVGWSHK